MKRFDGCPVPVILNSLTPGVAPVASSLMRVNVTGSIVHARALD